MLTICIPTYNRRSELEVALNGLERVFGNTVHVAISDNCSTDDTVEFLAAFAGRSPFASFCYVVNERNRGVDYNFLNAVSLGKTEYSILFGSDDTPTVNAPELINAAISEGVDVAVFGRRLYTRNLKHAIGDQAYWSSGARTVWQLKDESDFADYFSTCTSLAGAFSYISGILFRKSAWHVDERVRSYVGSYYVHVAALFQGMKILGTVRLLTDPRPVVCCRLGNDSFIDNGVFRRFEIDWNAYERLAREYFAGPAGENLALILRYQCSFYGLASLRYHIMTAGQRAQIGQVTRRLLISAWGRAPLIRWRMINLLPLFTLQWVFRARRMIRGGLN